MALIAFFGLLTSDLVGWDPAMHSDGLVSKESLRADAVGAMVVGAVVGACDGASCGGQCWFCGWYYGMPSEVHSGSCNGGAEVNWLELLWVLLPLSVHVVVVVVVS